MKTVRYAAKALVAFAYAFLSVLAGVVVDGSTLSTITLKEWIAAVVAGLATLGTTFYVKNGPKPRRASARRRVKPRRANKPSGQ